jgi:hypothetical protein
MLFHIPVLDRHFTFIVEAKSAAAVRERVHADLMKHLATCARHISSARIDVNVFGDRFTNIHYLLNGDIREVFNEGFAEKHITPDDIALKIRRIYRTVRLTCSCNPIVRIQICYGLCNIGDTTMTPKDFQKLLNKLKGLFRLAKQENIHEAALAREKAEAIMAKYNISAEDLTSPQIEDIIEIDIELAMKSNTPSLLFAKWCGNAFNVKALQVGKTDGRNRVIGKVVRFIGTTADVAVSTYVYGYVHHLLIMKTDEYFLSIKDQNKVTMGEIQKIKDDFAFGFADSVCKKLEAIAAANAAKAAAEEAKMQSDQLAIGTHALAIIKNDLIEQYIKEKYGDAGNPDKDTVRFDANHFGRGQVEGNKVGIYRGVADKTKSKKQIGG